MKPAAPQTIGRYEVLGWIAQGGMGTVYRARDPKIGRIVAIKLLLDGIDDEHMRERFMREAQAAGALKHGNIVTVFELGEHDGRPFIAMEHVEGEPLSLLLKRRPALSLAWKLRFMDQLCSGLHYAHRIGLVHRDVKPANIMLDDQGTVKILDFGIARLGPSDLTRTGMLMGTLNYMAPEQLESQTVDARADVFSVGAVFYELISFRHAFSGERPSAVMHQILCGSPPALDVVCPGADPDVIAIITKCLEKQPESRYQDLAAVRRDLRGVRRRLEVAGDDEAGPTLHEIEELSPSGMPGSRRPSRDSTPPPSHDLRQRAERIRLEQIQSCIGRARRALDAGNIGAAFEACEQALVLDPGNLEVRDLETRARAIAEQFPTQGTDEVPETLGTNGQSGASRALMPEAEDVGETLKLAKPATHSEAPSPVVELEQLSVAPPADSAAANHEGHKAHKGGVEGRPAVNPTAATVIWPRFPEPSASTRDGAIPSRREPPRSARRIPMASAIIVLLLATVAVGIYLSARNVGPTATTAENRPPAEATAPSAAEPSPATSPVATPPVTPSQATIGESSDRSSQPETPARVVERPKATSAPVLNASTSKATGSPGTGVKNLTAPAATVSPQVRAGAPVKESSTPAKEAEGPPGAPPPVQEDPGLVARYVRAKEAVDGASPASAIPLIESLQREHPTFRDRDVAALLAQAREKAGTAAKQALDAARRLEASDDLEGALREYTRAHQLDPSTTAVSEEGANRVKSRMKAEGTDALRRAKQFDALGRVDQAIAAYDRAYRYLPNEDANKEAARIRRDALKAQK